MLKDDIVWMDVIIPRAFEEDSTTVGCWSRIKNALELAQQTTNTGSPKFCPYHKNYSSCAWGLNFRCKEFAPCEIRSELRASA